MKSTSIFFYCLRDNFIEHITKAYRAIISYFDRWGFIRIKLRKVWFKLSTNSPEFRAWRIALVTLGPIRFQYIWKKIGDMPSDLGAFVWCIFFIATSISSVVKSLDALDLPILFFLYLIKAFAWKYLEFLSHAFNHIILDLCCHMSSSLSSHLCTSVLASLWSFILDSFGLNSLPPVSYSI